jgi:hypothetical protein
MAGSVDITGRQYYTFGIGHKSAQPQGLMEVGTMDDLYASLVAANTA